MQAGGWLAEEMLRSQRARQCIAQFQAVGQIAEVDADLRRNKGFEHHGMAAQHNALFPRQGELQSVGSRRQVLGEGHLRGDGAARICDQRGLAEEASVGLEHLQHHGKGFGGGAVGPAQQGLHEGLFAVTVQVTFCEEAGFAGRGGQITARSFGRLADLGGIRQRQEGHVMALGILRHDQERLVYCGVEGQLDQSLGIADGRIDRRVIPAVEGDFQPGGGPTGSQRCGPDVQRRLFAAHAQTDIRDADQANFGCCLLRRQRQQKNAASGIGGQMVAQA